MVERRGPWTVLEEERLVALHKRFGSRWTHLAHFMPGRTAGGIHSHWGATGRRRGRPTVLKRYIDSLQPCVKHAAHALRQLAMEAASESTEATSSDSPSSTPSVNDDLGQVSCVTGQLRTDTQANAAVQKVDSVKEEVDALRTIVAAQGGHLFTLTNMCNDLRGALASRAVDRTASPQAQPRTGPWQILSVSPSRA